MEYNETDTCWHILTVTHGGTVSILRNLDAPTARQTYQRLDPDSRPKEYINIPKGGGGWSSWGGSLSDRTITKVHVLGPEGADLEPWRGVEPQIVDVGARSRHFA